jgi:hypothetical protein
VSDSVTATWLLPDEHSEASRRAYARVRASTVDAHASEPWPWDHDDVLVRAARRQSVTVLWPEDLQ